MTEEHICFQEPEPLMKLSMEPNQQVGKDLALVFGLVKEGS
jgi:hypothetical protein